MFTVVILTVFLKNFGHQRFFSIIASSDFGKKKFALWGWGLNSKTYTTLPICTCCQWI